MNWVRKLYDWVLHWAETPYGPLALFVLSFTEASFFPVPPDVLLIALALGAQRRSLVFALNCSLASILGALFGYSIGHFAWWSGPEQFSRLAYFFFDHVPGFSIELFHRLQALYREWDFWVVFTAGFTPIPFKVFTISAGAFDINMPMFLGAALISRSTRFLLIAGLIWKFGEPIRDFIDRYFNLLAFLFTLLLIGGFVVVKYII
jgi:membrane protein YqaA with SNARE-associated domain